MIFWIIYFICAALGLGLTWFLFGSTKYLKYLLSLCCLIPIINWLCLLLVIVALLIVIFTGNAQ